MELPGAQDMRPATDIREVTKLCVMIIRKGALSEMPSIISIKGAELLSARYQTHGQQKNG